ncbi:BTB/POZ and MATH domain-containing protein 5-like [Triticum aestivum]|uniref:BTB/POZ and MATH domain-containing protein 5-like n=1 Tax=Triticum aestivum TaxID=4565 RepID=UPI001D02E68B|nr:BTB/POZ and MATH domain-containing protein 5-like [Triticum aestivum]
MAFAGMSLVTAEGKLCTSTVSPIDSRAARGYHLLAVEGFSRNKTPTGQYIRSRTFLVGGRRWYLNYYPNGCDYQWDGWVSVSIGLEDDEDDDADDDEQKQPVKVRLAICLIDQFQWQESVYIHECETEDFVLNSVICDKDFIRRSTLERSSYLKDDSFIIRFDVSVLDVKADVNTEVGATTIVSRFIQVPPSDLAIHFRPCLKDLLMSKEGADVTFEVGGEAFAAHQCVLAARSMAFKSQLFGDTPGGATVKIDGIEAEVFKSMLTFIYTDTLPVPDWNKIQVWTPEGAPKAVQHVMWLLQLLEAAERYDLHRLKLICQDELGTSIQLKTVADIIVGAERGHYR